MLARLAWAGPGLCLRGARLASHHGKEPTKKQWPNSSRIETQSRTLKSVPEAVVKKARTHSKSLAAVVWDEKKPASQVGSCRI